jgi:hypothetical protein
MNQLVIALDENELIWLKRIITDQDGEAAMEFMNKVMKPRLKEAERPSGLQRTFDAGGPPGQIGGPR